MTARMSDEDFEYLTGQADIFIGGLGESGAIVKATCTSMAIGVHEGSLSIGDVATQSLLLMHQYRSDGVATVDTMAIALAVLVETARQIAVAER